MNNQSGLDQKDFNDLIDKLNRRNQESSTSTKISLQDVQDILQDQGLLSALLEEHLSFRHETIKKIEQENVTQRSLLIKSFTVFSFVIASLFSFGGYVVGGKFASNNSDIGSSLASSYLTSKAKINENGLYIIEFRKTFKYRIDCTNKTVRNITNQWGEVTSASKDIYAGEMLPIMVSEVCN